MGVRVGVAPTFGPREVVGLHLYSQPDRLWWAGEAHGTAREREEKILLALGVPFFSFSFFFVYDGK